MKNIAIIFLLMGCAACTPKPQVDDTVSTKYVHQYGVELASETDWVARGASGEIVRTQKDGVTLRECYVQGNLHGISTTTFPHQNTVAKSAHFEDGVLIEEIFYYQAGTPSSKKTYHQENRVHILAWYEDGTPRASEEYAGELLKNAEYFTISNDKESIVSKGCGTRTCRDKLGHIIARDTIEMGTLVLQETYHPNGTPSAHIPYSNGKIHGICKRFCAGGEPKSIEEWHEGVLHGSVQHFQNGQLVATVPYSYGQKHGIEKHFQDSASMVVEEIHWSHDQRHGPSLCMIDGQKIVDWYYEGKKVPKSQFVAKGH